MRVERTFCEFIATSEFDPNVADIGSDPR